MDLFPPVMAQASELSVIHFNEVPKTIVRVLLGHERYW